MDKLFSQSESMYGKNNEVMGSYSHGSGNKMNNWPRVNVLITDILSIPDAFIVHHIQ